MLLHRVPAIGLHASALGREQGGNAKTDPSEKVLLQDLGECQKQCKHSSRIHNFLRFWCFWLELWALPSQRPLGLSLITSLASILSVVLAWLDLCQTRSCTPPPFLVSLPLERLACEARFAVSFSLLCCWPSSGLVQRLVNNKDLPVTSEEATASTPNHLSLRWWKSQTAASTSFVTFILENLPPPTP